MDDVIVPEMTFCMQILAIFAEEIGNKFATLRVFVLMLLQSHTCLLLAFCLAEVADR